MGLSAGAAVLGATLSRLFNRAAYDVANKLPANATVAANDVIVTYDQSLDYKPSYSLLSDVTLASGGGTAGTVVASKGVVVDTNKDIAIFRNASAVKFVAGASGTAGTLAVFPTTASKGQVNVTASDATGDTITTVNVAAQATTRTYTVPDAGADASFMMTQGAQTVAGVKTLSNMLKIPINTPVAGAGTVIGDAAPILTGFTVITGANGTVGWILPVTTGGDIVIIKGTTAGVAKLWPQSGAQINAVGASTAMSLASGVIPAILISISATQWYTLPLLPS